MSEGARKVENVSRDVPTLPVQEGVRALSMLSMTDAWVSPLGARLAAAISRVCAMVGDGDASVAVGRLDDGEVLARLDDVAIARRSLDVITSALTAEVEKRSTREAGYAGLAQKTGHRTGTDLVQHITGQTRADVRRAAAIGRDLAAAVPFEPLDSTTDASPSAPWFDPLTTALADGVLSREQFDVIRRGLGEPPVERYPERAEGVTESFWREAALVLIGEAVEQAVEDLAVAARLARDTLDPIGTQLRFDERFARRSLTLFIDEHGQQIGRVRFDDDAAAWVRTILNASLRPRRGPRFVDSADASDRASDAGHGQDNRTNEQLQYDTMMAILRTGAAADPRQAFGDRQPGVRIVTPVSAVARPGEDGASQSPGAVGVYEETGQAIAPGVLETYLCDAATLPVSVDGAGVPLDVGRESRLFTRSQRIALAVRDGGCLWCGAEPSRCEAHHINHWVEHHGRTDLADGVLLCRNCHMRLHNLGWRILRDAKSYWLHAPPESGIDVRRLSPHSPLRFLAVRRT